MRRRLLDLIACPECAGEFRCEPASEMVEEGTLSCGRCGRLFSLIQAAVPLLWPLSSALVRIPRLGGKLRHLIPISNYMGVCPLSDAQLREWSVLDTFDMFAPQYDHRQSPETVREWFTDARLEKVEVFKSGLLTGRGARPSGNGA